MCDKSVTPSNNGHFFRMTNYSIEIVDDILVHLGYTQQVFQGQKGPTMSYKINRDI